MSATAIENVADWANWHVVRDAPQCSPANADGDSASSPQMNDGDDNALQNCSPRAAVACSVRPVAGCGAGDSAGGSCCCSRHH